MRPRFGLVGIGDAGRHHAVALRHLERRGALRFSSFFARDAQRGLRFAQDLDLAAVGVGSLEALLEGCDAVVLATPDAVHLAGVLAAARAGKHVLVEKPLALSRADGEQAVEACVRAGVTLAVGYHLRFHAGHRALSARGAELLGRPEHLAIHWAWPDPATDGWRAKGVGANSWALAALGTHAVDLALWLMEEHPLALHGFVARQAEVDRSADAVLAFPGGRAAHLSVSVGYRATPRLLLAGPRGEVVCSGTLGARGAGEVLHRADRADWAPVAFEAIDPYAAQLLAFARAIAGEPWIGASTAHVLENLRILDRWRSTT